MTSSPIEVESAQACTNCNGPQADDLIAIIGMSCKFSGDADTPERLWDLCESGKSAWSEVPSSRFNGKTFHNPDHRDLGTINAAGAHFINTDVAKFDATFFNFSYEAASTMDPQIRLQLESVFEATEDAGLPLARLAGSNTSVFAGCFTRDYNDGFSRDPDNIPQTVLTGNGASMVSNRTSHFFDLTGPSMTVDTACSTSLTCLHLACQSLKSGDSTMSIVTATNLILYTSTFVALSNLGLLGASGKCYAWDDRAHGYGRGEGIATMIIKPLSRAIADKDNIRAVIRGSALNQDGKTPTITSPSVDAQVALMRDCYRAAGLDPKDTPYVEAHMTGTQVGDPIEAEAISTVFTKDRSPDDPVLVGSIKTIVGHTEATSGLAGVMKAVLAVERGLIPPNANFERPNSNINLQLWNLKVPTQLTAWPQGLPRRISINNFGFGGANAHAIVEAYNPGSPATQSIEEAVTINGHNGDIHSNGSVTSNGVHKVVVPSSPKAAMHISDHVALSSMKSKVLKAATNGQSNGIHKDANHAATEPSTHTDLTSNGNHTEPSRVFLLSSKDGSVTDKMRSNLVQWLEQKRDNGEQVDLASLSYTLAERRSRLPYRIAVTAGSTDDLITALTESRKATAARDVPRIGLVFNGQGGQWYAMGRELFAYTVFAEAMQEADAVLKRLGASWSLIDELHKDEAFSRVQQPAFSQPLCTALQLALVRLLASWDVKPQAVVSHSSGEAAAAYCAGGLTFAEALSVVYYRGLLTERYQQVSEKKGAMLAAGISASTAQPYLEALTSGRAVVACINSPENVTISGDEEAIVRIEELLKQDGHFARRLKVDAAYHSHHMLPMAEEYLSKLSKAIESKRGKLDCTYGCPVTGELLQDKGQLQPSHWVQNLTQPVQFSSALQAVCLAKDASSSKTIDFLIEVGPSGTLAGPIRQCLRSLDKLIKPISYTSCLTRGSDASITIQQALCNLVCSGQNVDLTLASPESDCDKRKVLSGLPTYPWNHAVSYWKENRVARAYRFRTDPAIELLGRIDPGCNPLMPTWRNFLKVSNLPWLRDHVVQSEMVLPGAGYVSMAIEAIKQLLKPSEETFEGFSLRKVDILRALVIPDTEEGIEIQLTLSHCSDSELDGRGWWAFSVSSVTHSESAWVEHGKGLIALQHKPASSLSQDAKSVSSLFEDRWSETQSGLWKPAEPGKFFTTLRQHGIVHGPIFQNLQDIQVNESRSSTTFHIHDCKYADTDQPSTLVIHPTTLDSIVQAAYPALNADALDGCMVLPRSIEHMFISAKIPQAGGHLLEAKAQVSTQGKRGFSSSLQITDKQTLGAAPVAELTGLFCQAIPTGALGKLSEMPRTCFKMVWKPDWTFLSSAELKGTMSFSATPAERETSARFVRAAYHLIHDALAQISTEDVQNMNWHQLKMLDWMKAQDSLGAEGKLGKNSSSWHKSSQGIKQLLLDEVSASSADGRLLCRMGQSLPDILCSKAAPLELMMADNLLSNFYEHSVRNERSRARGEHLVAQYAHKTPHGRVLEIGAGTGSFTKRFLGALPDNGSANAAPLARYDFTDISSAFFEQARDEFAAWGDLIHYQKLDIETDPTTQGFEKESYDLVVACLVLHATKDLEITLANVRKLLKPGGKLVLIETTKDLIDVQLIFGTLPGWWLGKDRPDSPNVSAEAWQKLLTTTGFSGIDAQLRDFDDEDEHSISTMLSTAISPPRYPETLSIVITDNTPQHWAQDLAADIKEQTGIDPAIKTIDSLHGDQHCIFLIEMQQALLTNMDEKAFTQIHDALLQAETALWVTNGDVINGSAPEYAPITGLLRTLRLEESRKRFVTCDLASQHGPWTRETKDILIKLFKASFDLEQSPAEIDTEYSIRDAQLHIARVHEDMEANNATRALTKITEPHLGPFADPDTPLRIDVNTPGLIDSLVFVEDEALSKPLPEDQIEIEPKAFGLNFRDVLTALGHIDGNKIGFECSGIVTKIGSQAHGSELRVGDRVCAVMQGYFGNRVRVHWTCAARIPEQASLEEAATIPLVFATAYQALTISAQLEQGETVLIHAASGGVGQAAIMIAQLKGATIFATVGTDAKKQFIHETYGIPLDNIFSSRNDSFAPAIMARTKGAGVDVILNSLAGNLLKASWECIASFGRFIEIGRRDIEQDKALNMLPFGRATTFATVDLNYLMQFRSHKIKQMMDAVMQLWRANDIRAVGPITKFPMSDLTGAFRLMQSGKHVGKIILVPQAGDEVQRLPSIKHFKPAADASYLIVGGLGGIGQSLARYLASIGCPQLVMLSRSATQHDSAEKLVSELKLVGCTVTLRDCDASDAQMLDRTLADLKASGIPPIRGVIQAAVVWQDSTFETLDHKKWQTSLRPKVTVTRNLHNAFKDLDFFVMLASIAGVTGSPGQSNYAAGSTFQDAFARYRARNGLPAVSIDLGPISDVGHAAVTEGIIDRFKSLGLEPITEAQTMRIIEAAMCNPARTIDSSQLVTGLRLWDEAMNVMWSSDHRIRTLKRNSVSGLQGGQTGRGKAGAAGDLRDAMVGVKTWDEAVQCCLDAMVRKMQGIFALTADDIDVSRPMMEYGVDSLVAVEVRNWLALSLQADVSIFDIMQSASLQMLAEKTVEKSAIVGDMGLKKAAELVEQVENSEKSSPGTAGA